MSETGKPDLTALAVQLLSAYVSNNAVPNSDLAALIRTTKTALADDPEPVAEPAPEHVPAVSAKASLASRDHIISLIDGKPYKSLKRHLSTRGLTPEEYRTRYNLPSTYPMVAPSYSEQRRRVAHQLGLGRKPAATENAAAAQQAETASEPAEKRKPRAKPAASRGKTPKRAPRGVQKAESPAAQPTGEVQSTPESQPAE